MSPDYPAWLLVSIQLVSLASRDFTLAHDLPPVLSVSIQLVSLASRDFLIIVRGILN